MLLTGCAARKPLTRTDITDLETGRTTDKVSETLPESDGGKNVDSSTYETVKSNEEVMAYGYDENGNLALPMSELRHCEEVYWKLGIICKGYDYPVSDRFTADKPKQFIH